MNFFVTICYILNVALFVYAFTRPSSAWLAADRNRSFWLTLLAILGLMGVPGLGADVAFLIGVLPRMLTETGATTTERGSSEDPNVRPNPFTKN
ncbi:hypothetical protein BMF89_20470 [Arthrobacter sp. SRS-W-1-2016]|uniref:hypothetical protein n=1 Tax=Arthrobacter sp. SRS-W-1-2016 TaxID=1930254 RepID=UPI00099132C5|nr:hypothetical protein [Arthrobacter sp. SRS-W-1-2016]OOP59413.1 hypothetical protein BMF89_20470 [Arthrobacter sp. SRS-W-1-2016]